MPPHADRGGSTSVHGLIRSLHSSGSLRTSALPVAYGAAGLIVPRPAGTDRQIMVSLNVPPKQGIVTDPSFQCALPCLESM